MAIYEPLATITLTAANKLLNPAELPELVHIEDPAVDVMIDFKRTKPLTVTAHEPIDDALNEMKVSGAHVLLVVNTNRQVTGLISTEDILGEKPIKFMQERRIPRADILVRMVMTPIEKVAAIDFESLKHAKVGNIINTLKELHQHYVLVITNGESSLQTIRGMFSSSQISKQLHMDIITNALGEANSVAELQKRKKY